MRAHRKQLFHTFDVDGAVLHQAGSNVTGAAVVEPGGIRPGTERVGIKLSKAKPWDRTVTTTTVDHLMEAQGLDTIDLLTIDAEGHDALVLRGAARSLAARRIQVLEFEYHGIGMWASEYALREVLERLVSAGYTCYWQGGASVRGALAPATPFCDEFEFREHSNVVCAHRRDIVAALDSLASGRSQSTADHAPTAAAPAVSTMSSTPAPPRPQSKIVQQLVEAMPRLPARACASSAVRVPAIVVVEGMNHGHLWCGCCRNKDADPAASCTDSESCSCAPLGNYCHHVNDFLVPLFALRREVARVHGADKGVALIAGSGELVNCGSFVAQLAARSGSKKLPGLIGAIAHPAFIELGAAVLGCEEITGLNRTSSYLGQPTTKRQHAEVIDVCSDRVYSFSGFHNWMKLWTVHLNVSAHP